MYNNQTIIRSNLMILDNTNKYIKQLCIAKQTWNIQLLAYYVLPEFSFLLTIQRQGFYSENRRTTGLVDRKSLRKAQDSYTYHHRPDETLLQEK